MSDEHYDSPGPTVQFIGGAAFEKIGRSVPVATENSRNSEHDNRRKKSEARSDREILNQKGDPDKERTCADPVCEPVRPA